MAMGIQATGHSKEKAQNAEETSIIREILAGRFLRVSPTMLCVAGLAASSTSSSTETSQAAALRDSVSVRETKEAQAKKRAANTRVSSTEHTAQASFEVRDRRNSTADKTKRRAKNYAIRSASEIILVDKNCHEVPTTI